MHIRAPAACLHLGIAIHGKLPFVTEVYMHTTSQSWLPSGHQPAHVNACDLHASVLGPAVLLPRAVPLPLQETVTVDLYIIRKIGLLLKKFPQVRRGHRCTAATADPFVLHRHNQCS
jgi:hypothetical protein